MDKERLRRLLLDEQREFDGKLADLRQWYEAMPLTKRKRFRGWLERLNKVASKSAEWSLLAHIQVPLDEHSEADFTLTTTLWAIRAWDEGKDFAPEMVLP